MSREFCAECNVVRNVEVTTSRRKVRGADGKEREIVTKLVHCEACHSFIRSEEAGTGAGKSANT